MGVPPLQNYDRTIHRYLKNAGEEDIGEIGIDNFQLLGRVGLVLVQKLAHNSGQGGHFATSVI